jgi:hypothetical protein
MILSLKAKEDLPEVQCLQPREACANPQVNLLPCPHSLGQVPIGCSQVLHCMLNVFLGQRREMCPLYMQVTVHCVAYVDDLCSCLKGKRGSYIECYGFTFAITIQPENQLVRIFRMILHVFDDIYVVLQRYLLQVNCKSVMRLDSLTSVKSINVRSLPILALVGELVGHDVAKDLRLH